MADSSTKPECELSLDCLISHLSTFSKIDDGSDHPDYQTYSDLRPDITVLFLNDVLPSDFCLSVSYVRGRVKLSASYPDGYCILLEEIMDYTLITKDAIIRILKEKMDAQIKEHAVHLSHLVSLREKLGDQ